MPAAEGSPSPELRNAAPGKESGADREDGNKNKPITTATLTKGSWRELLKVHPAASIFPMMTDRELDDLGKDIKRRGLQQPIALLPDRTLLDGRNRLEAAQRAGFALFKEDGSPIFAHFKIVGGGGSFDPLAYIASANIHRRHLDREQRRDLISRLLKANPARSNNATAKIAQVSDKTVAAVREELGSEIPNHETRVGADGVAQPARRPKPKAPTRQAEAIAAARDIAALARHLENTRRQLLQRQRQLDAMPLAGRVAHARGLLAALKVTVSDLEPIGGVR